MGSGSGLHQEVLSKEAVVGGTVVEEVEGHKKGRLWLFGNSITVNIFYAFLNYRPLKNRDEIVEGSITKRSRLDAWVAAALIRLEKKRKRGGTDRKCTWTLLEVI